MADADVTGAYETCLILGSGYPDGALEGCPGDLQVDIERNDCGSWTRSCSMDLSVRCEGRGCWWSRQIEGPITLPLLRVAEQMHAQAASANAPSQP